VDGRTYWFLIVVAPLTALSEAYLLPLLRRILDRLQGSARRPRRVAGRAASRDPFSAPCVVNGEVVAGWKTIAKNGSSIGLRLSRLSQRE
jgi:hypothetical protein